MMNGRLDKLKKNSPFQVITVNPNSVPLWGSSFQYDIKIKNVDITDAMLSFQLPALSGLTGGSPYLCPAEFWYNYIEVSVGNQIVQYIFSDCSWILNQTCNTDEKRGLLNAFQPYTSTALRVTRSAQSHWYHISLRTLFSQTTIPLLTTNSEFTVKIFLNNLADNVVLNGATGTPSATIISSLLTLRTTRLVENEVQDLTKMMMKTNLQHHYHNQLFTRFPVASGATQSTHTLSFATGSIDTIFFIVRPDTGLVGDAQFTFTEISSFEIRDQTGQNATGGNPITSTMSICQLSKNWFLSSYLAEAYNATASNSFVYAFSWSSSPSESLNTGEPMGSRVFSGFESLVINYRVALPSATSVDCFCIQSNVLQQSLQGMRKVTNFNS